MAGETHGDAFKEVDPPSCSLTGTPCSAPAVMAAGVPTELLSKEGRTRCTACWKHLPAAQVCQKQAWFPPVFDPITLFQVQPTFIDSSTFFPLHDKMFFILIFYLTHLFVHLLEFNFGAINHIRSYHISLWLLKANLFFSRVFTWSRFVWKQVFSSESPPLEKTVVPKCLSGPCPGNCTVQPVTIWSCHCLRKTANRCS